MNTNKEPGEIRAAGLDSRTVRAVRRNGWFLAAVWTVVLAASLAWNLGRDQDAVYDLALTGARQSLDKDVLHHVMRPFVTAEPCLKCHRAQGFRVGDVRGGLSVSIPIEDYVASLDTQQRALVLWHTVLWLVGLLGIASTTLRTMKLQRNSDMQRARNDTVLAESEARYRSYVESAPYGVVVTDELGRLQQANPAACRLSEHTEEELLAMSLRELLSEKSQEAGLAHFRLLLETGACSAELHHKTKTGVERTWIVDAVKITETRFLGFIQDITDKKEAEAETRHLQRLESIGTLAAGVAHEINNPLNVIMNYGQLILDEEGSTQRSREFATQIVDQGERVATIVRALLAFSRRDRLSFAPVELKNLIDTVLPLVYSSLRSDGIGICARFADGIPPLSCSGQQIQQVFMNLLTNARDALKERDPDRTDAKTICIGVSHFEENGARWVRTVVEDNGAGVPAAIAARIFDPFFSTKPKDKGTGLGLSICHGIVREHGGKLWFESEPGKGTKFYVDLRADPGRF